MSESGGHADKLGNRYEALWVAKQLLRVVQGQLTSVQAEALGDEEVGVDVWLVDDAGRRIACQCKSGNSLTPKWTMYTLGARGVLRKAQQQLAAGTADEFTFVSSVPATGLDALGGRARDNEGNARSWLENQVRANKGLEKEFLQYCKALSLDHTVASDLLTCFEGLARSTFTHFRDDGETRRDLRAQLSYFFEGEPSAALAVLRTIAVDNPRRRLYQDDINREMEDAGFRPRLLAGDARSAPAVDELWKTYEASIQPHLLGGQLLSRSSAPEILRLLEEDARIIAVHAAAGYGKSCLLYAVCKELRAQRVPVLAIRLDRQSLEQDLEAYGRSLGLPGAPHLTLKALAGDRRAVLVVDQLDALQWTGKNAASGVAAFERLCRESLDHLGLSIIVACRSFDLKHDPILKKWVQAQQAAEVALGELPEETARKYVGQTGHDWNKFTSRQQTLLRSPLALGLWLELDRPGFRTMSDLMRAYWCKRWTQLAERNAEAEGRTLVHAMLEFIERQGELSMPSHKADLYRTAASALQSLHVLVDDGKRITFSHQSFSDYLLAQRVVDRMREERKTFLELAPNRRRQTLYFRHRLRHVLNLLRDAGGADYTRTIRELLESPDVRFHLKHLTLQWAGGLPDPSDEEQAILDAAHARSQLKEHVVSLTYAGSEPWTRRLFRRGDLLRAARSEDETEVSNALSLMRQVRDACGDQIAKLIQAGDLDDPKWQKYAQYVLPFHPENDSASLFEIRLELARRCVSGERHIWGQLALSAPSRCIELLAAYMDGPSTHAAGSCEHAIGVPELHGSEPLSLARAGAAASELAFERLETRFRSLCTLSDGMDLTPRTRRAIVQTRTAVLFVLTGAAIAASDRVLDERYQAAACRYPPLYGSMLMHAPKELADSILRWLLADEANLRMQSRGFTGHTWSMACRIISRFASHASDETYELLEASLLAYRDESELESIRRRHDTQPKRDLSRPNEYGRPRYFLLGALPNSRLGARARNEHEMLVRKFHGTHVVNFPRHISRAGWVTSPLSQQVARRMSDRKWLELVASRRTTGGKWNDSQENRMVVSGVEEFARDLGQVAQLCPERFSRLAAQFPEEAWPYTSSVLSALSSKRPPDSATADEREFWQPASAASVRGLLQAVSAAWREDYGIPFVRLIKAYPDVDLPETVLDRLCRLAENADPKQGSLPVTSSREQDYRMAHDLEVLAINCTRGCAAEAIGAVLGSNPESVESLKSAIDALAVDEHPAVRVAALSIAAALMMQGAKQGIDYLLKVISNTEQQVMISHSCYRLLSWSFTRDRERIGDVFDLMASSDDDAVARVGAGNATAAKILHGEDSLLFDRCLGGSSVQRRGVARAAADLFRYEDHTSASIPILRKLLTDEEAAVRREAKSCFRGTSWLDRDETVEFARECGHLTALQENPETVISALHRREGSLLKHSELVFAVCDAYRGDLAQKSRSIQHAESAGAHWLGPVLFRLYEEASRQGESTTVQRCLDAVDHLLERRVGIRSELTSVLDS